MKNSKKIIKLFTITSNIPNDLIVYVVANSLKEAYNKFKTSKFKDNLGNSFDIERFPQSKTELSIISKNQNKSHLCYYQAKNEITKILIAESIEQCFDYLKDLDLKEFRYHGDSNDRFIF